MKENMSEKVEKFKESGEKYNTWKLAKSYNLGRVVLALIFLLILILIFMNL